MSGMVLHRTWTTAFLARQADSLETRAQETMEEERIEASSVRVVLEHMERLRKCLGEGKYKPELMFNVDESLVGWEKRVVGKSKLFVRKIEKIL